MHDARLNFNGAVKFERRPVLLMRGRTTRAALRMDLLDGITDAICAAVDYVPRQLVWGYVPPPAESIVSAPRFVRALRQLPWQNMV